MATFLSGCKKESTVREEIKIGNASIKHSSLPSKSQMLAQNLSKPCKYWIAGVNGFLEGAPSNPYFDMVLSQINNAGGVLVNTQFDTKQEALNANLTFEQSAVSLAQTYNLTFQPTGIMTDPVSSSCNGDIFDPGGYSGGGIEGGSGTGGNGGFLQVPLRPTITIDPNTRPCLESIKNAVVNAAQISVTMANLLKRVDNDHTKAQNAVLALANNTNISITLGEKTIPYQTITNPDGTTSVRETHGETNPITGSIKLNTLTLNEASDLAVTASLIHEMMHSYFVWGANNLTGEEAMAFSDLNRYLFDQEDGTAHPYNYPELGFMQHWQMGETYVNSMALILLGVANSKGITTSPDPSISLEVYCRDIFWGSLQQTSGLDAPNAARSKTNSEREYKNQSGSTGKNDCQP